MNPDEHTAWVRVAGNGWHAVATGSERSCWGVLLSWQPAGPAHVDKVVLPRGDFLWRQEHAGGRRRPRPRRGSAGR